MAGPARLRLLRARATALNWLGETVAEKEAVRETLAEATKLDDPAAIASAVEDALQPFGIRVEELPLSPERVWQLIRKAEAST